MAYKILSLSQAAQFDKANNLKNQLTGWGKVSQDRRERGISRKARRLKKKQEVK